MTRTVTQTQDDTAQLPPHAPDAEMGVLGCCLLEASAIEEIQDRIKAWGSQVFFDLRHRKVWEICLELATDGVGVDLISLATKLRDAGQLDACGGLVYLNEVASAAHTTANLEYYLEVLIEKYILRRVVAGAAHILGRVHQTEGSATQLVSEYQESVISLVEEWAPSRIKPQAERMSELIDTLERRHRGRQEITGLSTPFWYLNNMTAGLHPELIVVAARPSCGKTAFGTDLAIHTLREGKAVLFFSIEMAADAIDMRMLGNLARVNGLKLRNGFWRDDAMPRMETAIGEMAGWKLHLDDRSVITGQDILLTSRRIHRTTPLSLIVVDYAQLLAGVHRYNNAHERISEAMGFLKRTVKELKVPLVVMAQLSRDVEKERAGRPPVLADLKESGSIEQDADLVLMLWEPKIDPRNEDDMKWLEHHQPEDPKEGDVNWEKNFRRINLLVAKNRNGPTGPCELVFIRTTCRFVDAHSPRRTTHDNEPETML